MSILDEARKASLQPHKPLKNLTAEDAQLAVAYLKDEVNRVGICKVRKFTGDYFSTWIVPSLKLAVELGMIKF